MPRTRTRSRSHSFRNAPVSRSAIKPFVSGRPHSRAMRPNPWKRPHLWSSPLAMTDHGAVVEPTFKGDEKAPMRSPLARVEDRLIRRLLPHFPRWIQGSMSSVSGSGPRDARSWCERAGSRSFADARQHCDKGVQGADQPRSAGNASKQGIWR